ncbi:p106 [Rhizobium phage 16-3]|uniref:p106 n=1 Tax=Rhizobium phage 16-3 TaxID=10704 RepID=UPI00017BA663|nr:p106 [Rhizobium phage 16-3]ABF71352.1 p106 [Rhizobium phage 16-3]
MPKVYTMEQQDSDAEERDRERGLDEILKASTVESVEAEYRHLVGEEADNDA